MLTNTKHCLLSLFPITVLAIPRAKIFLTLPCILDTKSCFDTGASHIYLPPNTPGTTDIIDPRDAITVYQPNPPAGGLVHRALVHKHQILRWYPKG